MVGPLHVFSSIYKLILAGVSVCFWFDLMAYRSLLLDLALPGIAWVLVCFIKLHPIFDVVQICGFVFAIFCIMFVWGWLGQRCTSSLGVKQLGLAYYILVDRTRGNGLKPGSRGGSDRVLEETTSLKGWWGTNTDCLGRSNCPWRCSGTTEMWHRGRWFSRQCWQ